MNGRQDGAGVAIKTILGPIVTNLSNRFPRDVRVVNRRFRCDFTGYDNLAGCQQSLASNAGRWVLLKRSVQYGVRNLISDLVRVTLGNRLGSEQNSTMIIIQCNSSNTTIQCLK